MRGLAGVLACTAALAAGCGGPLERELVRLDAAERRWDGANVTAYQYDLHYGCCRAAGFHLRVTVEGEAVRSVIDLDSGTAADTAGSGPWLTIDRAFGAIREWLALQPEDFTATYHPVLGYPLTVSAYPAADGPSLTIANFITP
ncbi:MAG TPA: DUF6174 domain-containing protein [Gemmatimonadales bacterium]|nr:DUF6174 domain-containing protein [Gemmatimonadales bacterium]